MRLSRKASIGAGFVTAVVVLLALVAPSATHSSRALAQAAAPSCADIQFIGFHGTNEPVADPTSTYDKTLGLGSEVYSTWDLLTRKGKSPFSMSIEAADGFPFVPLPSYTGPFNTVNLVQFVLQSWAYGTAPQKAGDATTAQVQQIAASCPNSRFVFVGYSLGALAAHVTLQRLSEQKFDMAKVVAVVFFGDPAEPTYTTNDREGLARFFPNVPGVTNPYMPGDLASRTAHFCQSYPVERPYVKEPRMAYDAVCEVKYKTILKDVDLQNLLTGICTSQAGNLKLCPHLYYVENGVTQLAANWLAGILNVHQLSFPGGEALAVKIGFRPWFFINSRTPLKSPVGRQGSQCWPR